MPRKANFIFEVRIRINEAYTLDSIVRRPRTFKPKDVHSACQNNELAIVYGEPPGEVVNLVTYVMTDFFAMAHATGLYNRQKNLWESLSKVNSIHVHQLNKGLLKKQFLPIYDFYFNDYKGKPLLVANLAGEAGGGQKPLSVLKAFLGRAAGKASAGVLSFYMTPVPPEVVDFVQKQTFSPDPILRYESIMPGCNKPFDLLEMSHTVIDKDEPSEGEEAESYRSDFQLILPDLKKKPQTAAQTGAAAI